MLSGPPIGGFLMAAFGFRISFYCFAFVYLVLYISVTLFLKDDIEEMEAIPEDDKPENQLLNRAEPLTDAFGIFRYPFTIFLVAGQGIDYFLFIGLVVNLANFWTVVYDLDVATISVCFSLVSVGTILAILTIPWLRLYFSINFLKRFGLLFYTVFSLFVSQFGSFEKWTAFYLFLVLLPTLSYLQGLSVMVSMNEIQDDSIAFLSKYRRGDVIDQVYAYIYLAQGAGELIGAVAASAMYDSTGFYPTVFWLSLVAGTELIADSILRPALKYKLD